MTALKRYKKNVKSFLAISVVGIFEENNVIYMKYIKFQEINILTSSYYALRIPPRTHFTLPGTVHLTYSSKNSSNNEKIMKLISNDEKKSIKSLLSFSLSFTTRGALNSYFFGHFAANY